MKRKLLVLGFLTLAACGTEDGIQSGQKGREICCGGNPSEMVFKTVDGREVVSWGEVTSAHVKILRDEYPMPNDGFERTFTGDDAKKLMSAFRLAWPKEYGSPLAIETGRVTIRYVKNGTTAEKVRTLWIMNHWTLEDRDFAGVTYEPGRALDRAWLEAQP